MKDNKEQSESIDSLVTDILDKFQVKNNRDVLRHLLVTAATMAQSNFERLNLKIATDALREFTNAFKVFEPYHSQRKITLFGSARTSPTDPAYAVAKEVASRLSQKGWMTITGAGQGIMLAGLEGAGPEMSFGINIKLPFEQGANHIIANDPKLVEMKYFFTRKVMLMKESDGFVIMPGGFGTLDETFELLTLIQTGKAQPAPVVLLDAKGGTYWNAWHKFINEEVISRDLVSRPDESLFLITQDIDAAIAEILDFYRNYHSLRFVGKKLIMRVNTLPTDDELSKLNSEFQDLCQSGAIEPYNATPQEIADGDYTALPRLSFEFNRVSHGRLRQLINAINQLPSAKLDKAQNLV